MARKGCGGVFCVSGAKKTMAVEFTRPTLSLGFVIALAVAIIAIFMGFMGMLPKESVMVILAICAVRL